MSILISILIITFVLGAFSNVLFGLSVAIGAIYYDLKNANTRNYQKNHPRAMWSRYHPVVSIIIPAHNEEVSIERCVRSLIKSSYRKIEVIVVDDKSSDRTSEIVKQLIDEFPKRTIKLLTKRKNVGRGGAINAGYIAHGTGDIIMAFDADCTIEKNAIRNGVRRFYDPKLSALAANVRIIETNKLLGLVQQFEYLSGFRGKKLNTLINNEHIVGGAGAMYRVSVFKKVKGFDSSMLTEDIALSLTIATLGNKKYRLGYGNDVVIFTEPVLSLSGLFKQRYRWKFGSLQALAAHKHLILNKQSSYSKTLTMLKLPSVILSETLLFLEPILLGYFVYIAIVNNNSALFIGAWVTVTGLASLNVWSDELFSIRTKIKMTLLSPYLYVLFYVMTSIQVVAAVKSVLNYKGIIGKKVVTGTWVSPERLAA